VYVWRHASGVLYVGATGLHPAARTALHLHHPDPDVGRVRARYPELAGDAIDVVAVAVPPGVSRRDVKACLIGILAQAGRLSAAYVGDAPVSREWPESVHEATSAALSVLSP
jgi:hypothetical protein